MSHRMKEVTTMTTIDNRPRNALYLIDAPADRYAVWEKRLHIDDIFMELALPWDSDADTVDIYNEIVRYSKENRIVPRGVAWDVIDNVLFANDKPVKRVGPHHNRYPDSPMADFWYDQIMERQERYMPD